MCGHGEMRAVYTPRGGAWGRFSLTVGGRQPATPCSRTAGLRLFWRPELATAAITTHARSGSEHWFRLRRDTGLAFRDPDHWGKGCWWLPRL